MSTVAEVDEEVTTEEWNENEDKRHVRCWQCWKRQCDGQVAMPKFVVYSAGEAGCLKCLATSYSQPIVMTTIGLKQLCAYCQKPRRGDRI